MTTLPKTYDDMVLRWPVMAWLLLGSWFVSGVIAVGISIVITAPFPIPHLIQIAGITSFTFVLFSVLVHEAMLGDALGFIGAFEKKEKL